MGVGALVRWILIIMVVLALGTLATPSCTNHERSYLEIARHECKALNQGPQSVSYKRDYQYARFQVFDVARTGDDNLLEPGDKITRFDLYEQIPSSDLTRGTNGIAYQDVRDEQIQDPVAPIPGRYALVEGDGLDWVLVRDDAMRKYPYLKFIATDVRWESVVLGYYLEVERGAEVVTIGSYAGDSAHLQILKTATPNPSDPFWDIEWKNVYALGQRNIDYDQFVLDIFKGQPGDEANPANLNNQSGVPYLQILGLDRLDVSGQVSADGRVDNNPTILDLDEGLLIFPDPRPFDSNIGYSLIYPDSTLNERVPEIYTTDNYTELQQKTTYYFRIGVPTRYRTQSLQRVNLVPESETVVFNGRQLIRGSDYSIDYDFGQVILRNDELLDPSGDLEICYEYYPLQS